MRRIWTCGCLWAIGLFLSPHIVVADAPANGVPVRAAVSTTPTTPSDSSLLDQTASNTDTTVRAIAGRVTSTSATINLAVSPNSPSALHARVVQLTSADGVLFINASSWVNDISTSSPAEIELTSLSPDTRYDLRFVVAVDESPSVKPSNPNTVEVQVGFRTAPLPGTGVTRFTVFADAHDNRTGWDTSRARAYWASRVVEDSLRGGPPDFFIQLGDWVTPKDRSMARPPLPAHASATDWYAQNRFGPYAQAYDQSGWFHVLGNHENEGWPRANEPGEPWRPTIFSRKNTAARKKFLPNPIHGSPDWGAIDPSSESMHDYYDFVWGNIHVIVLNPFVEGRYGDIGDTQFHWLEQVLADSTSRHVVVFAHYLALTSVAEGSGFGPYWDLGSAGIDRTKWHFRVHALFKRHGIDAFVFGHIHRFSHTLVDGVNYISIGVPTIESGFGQTIGAESAEVAPAQGEQGYAEFVEVGDVLRVNWRRAALAFPQDEQPFNWSTDANGNRSPNWRVDPVYSDGGAYGPRLPVQNDDTGFYVEVPPTTRALRGIYRPSDILAGGGEPAENLWRMPPNVPNVFDLDFSQSQRVNLTHDPGVDEVHVDLIPYTFHTIDLRRDPPQPPTMSADFDGDRDVDLRDVASISNCTDAPLDANCARADLDHDNQITRADQLAATRAMSGPGIDPHADLNRDGQTDIRDFPDFFAQFTGPFGIEPLIAIRPGADSDGDADVDLMDFARFQRSIHRDE